MKITPDRADRARMSPADSGRGCVGWTDTPGPSEEQVHLEHRAALDATLFQSRAAPDELVLELEAGLLRVRSTDR